MRRLALMTFLLAACMAQAVAAGRDSALADPYAEPGSFVVLSYHEARDDVRDYPDPYAVDSAALVQQFAWLRGNGYTPVSIDAIISARAGGKPLPPHAVLLSFDDAYLSFYTRVYPLLREFGFPAVLAVVGRWIDAPHGAATPYGEKGTVPDADFPSWRELREMADSGLVEIASHTFDLHHGILANPQGNLQPAATARKYDAANGSYESDASWRARVGADLARNSEVIARETGRRPRVIVWPYGSYNGKLLRIARESGMPMALTLDDGPNTPDVPLTAVRRVLIEHDPSLAEFAVEVRGPRTREPVRVVQVDLDEIYSADPLRQESNLSALLDRIEVLKPTHVFLRATTGIRVDNNAAAYFPNRYLPMRGDLFNRTAWQLASRTDVKVFAVMPLAGLGVTQERIGEIYEDLARHANFDGVVFDARPDSGEALDAASLELTRRLAARMRAFRMPMAAGRVLNFDPSAQRTDRLPGAVPGIADAIGEYDYVALMIRPEAAVDAASLAALGSSLGQAGGLPDIWNKVIFMLPGESWPADRAHPATIARQMRALQLEGALNFGYQSADFLGDSAPLEALAPAMSLRVYPPRLKEKEE